MKSKYLWLLLIFGLIITGCDNEPVNNDDIQNETPNISETPHEPSNDFEDEEQSNNEQNSGNDSNNGENENNNNHNDNSSSNENNNIPSTNVDYNKPIVKNGKVLSCSRTIEFGMYTLTEKRNATFINNEEVGEYLVFIYDMDRRYVSMLEKTKKAMIELYKDYEKKGYEMSVNTKGTTFTIILFDKITENEKAIIYDSYKESYEKSDFKCKQL